VFADGAAAEYRLTKLAMGRIHALSAASAYALGRLDATTDHNEALRLAEVMRTNFRLKAVEQSACIMFAQNLITEHGYSWHKSFTIGLSMAIKLYADSRFFLSDVQDYLTDAYSLDELKEAEVVAMGRIKGAATQPLVFRNALASLLLEAPQLDPAIGQGTAPDLHVLIVDDSESVRRLHRRLIHTAHPSAKVHDVGGVKAALEYLDVAAASEHPVTLVLLDLVLCEEDAAPSRSAELVRFLSNSRTSTQTNPLDYGLIVAESVDPHESEEPPIDMRGKPLVALVTNSIKKQAQRTPFQYRGCDVVLPKPLNLAKVRILIDCACA